MYWRGCLLILRANALCGTYWAPGMLGMIRFVMLSSISPRIVGITDYSQSSRHMVFIHDRVRIYFVDF
jgi:hypothetical protein